MKNKYLKNIRESLLFLLFIVIIIVTLPLALLGVFIKWICSNNSLKKELSDLFNVFKATEKGRR